MSNEAGFKVKISADAAGVKAELDAVAKSAGQSGGAAARAYAAVAVSVRAATDAVRGFSGALRIVSQASTAINAVIQIVSKAVEWFRNLRKASEEALSGGRAYADRAKGTALDVSLYDAVSEAARRAGVEADALNEKLRQYKEHKITFEELAASVGKTGEALKAAAGEADRFNVGRRFLSQEERRVAAGKERESQEKLEREGLELIVRRLLLASEDRFGKGQEAQKYWRMLLESTGGDRRAARDMVFEMAPWWARPGMGSRAFYGSQALEQAGASYDRDRAAAEARRTAGIAAHDAAVAAERKAKADKEAAAEAEKAAVEAKRIAEQKRREAEAAEKAAEAERKRVADARRRNLEQYAAGVESARETRDAAYEALRVSAPRAVNDFARKGGLLGADSSRMNLERMAEERTRRLAEINRKFDETLGKLNEHYQNVERALSE